MKTWTAAQLREFLSFVQDDRLRAAWTLIATTGVRRGEALGLRWEDVDLDEGRIAIRQTLINIAHEVRFSEPKTKAGQRSVALDQGTVMALREHRRQQLEERLAWGPAWSDNGLVFTREDGQLIHPSGFSKMFNRLVRKAGLPRIPLHGLRHTSASLMLQAGVHPKVVQERLGHSTISMTLDTYSHVIPALQEEAAAQLAALVFD